MDGAARVHNMTKNDPEKQQVAKEQVAVLNIFGARLWYDLHNNQGFIDLLREKITRKLLKVKVQMANAQIRVLLYSFFRGYFLLACHKILWVYLLLL